ncbi:MAG: hypothetical protein RL141_116 [Candidatus Parcubacteria bacterium]
MWGRLIRRAFLEDFFYCPYVKVVFDRKGDLDGLMSFSIFNHPNCSTIELKGCVIFRLNEQIYLVLKRQEG